MNFIDINFIVAGICWVGVFIINIEISNYVNKKYKKVIINEIPRKEIALSIIRLCLIFSIPIINILMLIIIVFEYDDIKQRAIELFEKQFINEVVIDPREEKY